MSTTTETPQKPNPQQSKKDKKGSEKEKKEEEGPSAVRTVLQVGLLLSLVPSFFFLGRVLAWAGELVYEREHMLAVLWVFYVIALAAIFFYFKKKTLSANAFIQQMLTWGIIVFGIYALADIPKYLPQEPEKFYLRKTVLYVWLSFTNIFNILWFILDDTNYRKIERREEKKEKRKEEKRKENEEKRKKRNEERRARGEQVKEPKKLFDTAKMNPWTKRMIDISIYVALLALVAYWFYNYYTDFQEKLEKGPLDERANPWEHDSSEPNIQDEM